MVRDIISIDEELCTGCGLCIPNCPEGALQIVEGKARLVDDSFCDGLGACLGECPEDAILVESRDAEAYDEISVISNILEQGTEVVDAHLEHLRSHGETEALKIAVEHLAKAHASEAKDVPGEKPASQLRQWPIQLHLISPEAPYFRGSDVVIAADCTAYAAGDFHDRFIKDRTIAVGCPKLDTEIDVYVDKISAMIDHSKINSLTVVMMQVPCCRGLLALTQAAMDKAEGSVPLKSVIVGVDGEILAEEQIA